MLTKPEIGQKVYHKLNQEYGTVVEEKVVNGCIELVTIEWKNWKRQMVREHYADFYSVFYGISIFPCS